MRAALVDEAGTALALSTAPLDRADSPTAWWRATEMALGALRGTAGLTGVRRVAVAGTSGTLLAIDRAGRPLGPASMYNAHASPAARTMAESVAPPESPARGATSPLARALDLATSLPNAARLVHQADWITGCLMQSWGSSDVNNALKTGYDALAGRWPDWIAHTGLASALLPDVVAPGSALGPIAPGWDLPRAAIVVAGTTDGCASFIATGAGDDDGVTALGSTLVLKRSVPRPISAPEYGLYSHRLGARWLTGGASNSGGAALARHFNAATLARLSARIDPARDSGLDYYPLPAPGERFPIADPALEPRESPRPADDVRFLHGLLEGIACIEALGYRRITENGGTMPAAVLSVGGGARNATFTAIRARILGVPLRPARSEEAAVGAALLALRGA